MKQLPSPAAPSPGETRNWQSLHGSAAGLAVARLAHRGEQFVLYVAANTEDAMRMRGEIAFYASGDAPLMSFPDWETLPYDNFSPHQDLISERLATLHDLPNVGDAADGLRAQRVLVTPVRTLMQRLPPVRFVEGQALLLAVGQRFDVERERERLQRAGYRSVGTVAERGEYAVRGSLLDLYPMGAALPYRIDLFDDEIESLRTFDPETQRTAERVEAVRVLPASEVPLDDDAVARFRGRWHRAFDADPGRCPIYQDLSQGQAHPGMECYLPFFFATTATLFDYLPAGAAIVLGDGALPAAAAFEEEAQARYQALRHDVERPIPVPHELYLSKEELFAQLRPFARAQIDPHADRHRHRVGFGGRPLPDLSASHRGQDEAARLRAFLEDAKTPVLLTAETLGRRQHFEDFLSRAKLRAKAVTGFDEFVAAAPALALTVAPIDRGAWLPDFAVVTEAEVFGRRNDDAGARRVRSGIDPELVVRNLTELAVGAPVVHIDHGVGRYRGLRTLAVDGLEHEFLALEYADEAHLYVPVAALHLISRYAGADAEHAPLHRLGTDQWEKAKRRAAAKAFDVAAELLDIQARRQLREGAVCAAPDEDYSRFCERFPFEATADQQAAIDAVLEDLCSSKPSDRLICGDVGFGKTEVAMRAAFIAVQSGRQVAVLAPTTLLAEQHHETFRDRFADWPVHIETLSRLRTAGEAKDIARRIAEGKVDIAVGTHRLLGADIAFKHLGLVIIDEEHRFGVRQKERLRALRAEVDVLALTATPIPRTLNIAMSGMRDLSVIATPPARRLSIKTFLVRRREHLVREAIDREFARGGQVFYVHNQVQSIDRAADELRKLAPAARIGVGHGQMPKRQLERAMADFYHRRSNLLVCTTIIENGIDIPNANTILIDRADRFGLAQLHQLRGRVGRSHRQAYAYLMTPDPRAITSDARKRLDAIEAAGELGIGFTLATHDLEIRGAGELLGEDQSGQIETVGFSLYMELLERAVASIKAGKPPDLDAPLPTLRDRNEINLHVQALIPEDHLPDVHARLIFYKRIANADRMDRLDALKAEMIDRFGPHPEALDNLFRATALKLSCQALGISRLDAGAASGRIDFADDTPVQPAQVVNLVRAEPQAFRLQGGATLRFNAPMADAAQRFNFVEGLLERLAQGETPRLAAGA